MLDLARKALKLATTQSDYAEIRAESSETNKLILKNGIIEKVDFSTSSGFCVRIIKDGAIGTAFTNSFNLADIKAAIKDAIKMSRASLALLKKPITFSEESPAKARYRVKEKIKFKDIEPKQKIDELLIVDKALLDTKINIQARYFELTDEIREKYYINSEGSEIYSKIPRISLDYLITILGNGRSEQRSFQLGAASGWEAVKNWHINNRVVSEAKTLSKILKAPVIKEDKYDIILSPELVGIAAHESCGHPYEADRILGREAAQAGESFVTAEMIGMKIGGEAINLADDPTIPGSYGFYKYDDEGVEAKRRLLIKDGKINTFLHNRQTAVEFGVKSNGAARASGWDAEPIVRMANTFFLPGDYNFEELLEGIKKGVYIKTYMEWNIGDKRFNQRYVGSEAYLIKNGQLTGLVRRPVIELTTPAFYSSIDAVGKKLEFTAGTCGKGEPMQGIPVWYGGPNIRLRNIRLR